MSVDASTELSPAVAAKLADAVYGIREVDDPARGAAERGVTGLDAHFELSEGRIATARSGAVLTARTGFALVLDGVAGTPWAGHRAVALRGTATMFDGATDLNISIDRGPAGTWAHAGFVRTFRSIRESIPALLEGHRGPVHVVGHSLGGALAVLTATELAARGRGDLHLYTFGAPRVFTGGSVAAFDRLVPAARVRRVQNHADLVPLVPIWPYRHAPAGGGSVVRVGPPALIPGVSNHYMSVYGPLVSREGAWGPLAAAGAETPDLRSVDHWIAVARENVRIPGGRIGLWALGKALNLLLGLAERVLGAIALGAVTVLDVLSSMLLRATEIAAAVGERVRELMAMILRWSGRAGVVGVELTRSFLGWVLGLILRPIAAAARSAMERLG
jgi:hypothetical protein